jgi:hypothetical protein
LATYYSHGVDEEDGSNELCTPPLLQHGCLKLLKALAKRHGTAKQGVVPDNGSLSLYISPSEPKTAATVTKVPGRQYGCLPRGGLEFCGKIATR